MTGDKTCTALFTLNTYTVTPNAGPNGSLNPSTPQAVNYNDYTYFTVTPDAGYHVASVTGCGGTLYSNSPGGGTFDGGTYTIAPVTSDCTVRASFLTNTYSVTPSAGPNGSIGPNMAQTVTYKGTSTFTVTPDAGYHIASVTGCGGTLSGNTFTTGPIMADCTVYATFAHDTTPSIKPTGDLNGDGTVDLIDALKALRIAVGLESVTEEDLARGDVAPLVNGTPLPDGRIDIGDAVVILRRAVGLVAW